MSRGEDMARSNVAFYASADHREGEVFDVVLVKDGGRGFHPHSTGWATLADAQRYASEQNEERGITPEWAEAIRLSSFTGRPAAEYIAIANAQPAGEVLCVHGTPLDGTGCEGCVARVAEPHAAELVGIRMARLANVQVRCRQCGGHRLHVCHSDEQ